MSENEKNKYSYQDCWNYALSLEKDIKVKEVKNDIITLCGVVPESFWLNFANKLLSTFEYAIVCRNLDRYVKESYPVPYLTNQVYFYGLNFYIEKGVFIPQKDTELLVEKTLELANKYWKKNEKLRVLEIGAGSGNIVISLAKNQPNWNFLAVDINPQSLIVAKKNSVIHQVKNVEFIHSKLFNALNQNEKFNIIVSNPPYISVEEYRKLPVIVKEQPSEALVAENNGYFFYQKIFQQAPGFLEKKFLLVVEIGHQQAEKVIKLIIEYFPQAEVSIFYDYQVHSRMIAIYQS